MDTVISSVYIHRAIINASHSDPLVKIFNIMIIGSKRKFKDDKALTKLLANERGLGVGPYIGSEQLLWIDVSCFFLAPAACKRVRWMRKKFEN